MTTRTLKNKLYYKLRFDVYFVFQTAQLYCVISMNITAKLVGRWLLLVKLMQIHQVNLLLG